MTLYAVRRHIVRADNPGDARLAWMGAGLGDGTTPVVALASALTPEQLAECEHLVSDADRRLAGVPSVYAGASRLDADANAMLSLARAKWHSLTRAQRRAVVDAQSIVGKVWLRASTGLPTRRVLIRRGLVDLSTCSDRNGRGALTGLGLMVREAGVYTREQPAK